MKGNHGLSRTILCILVLTSAALGTSSLAQDRARIERLPEAGHVVSPPLRNLSPAATLWDNISARFPWLNNAVLDSRLTMDNLVPDSSGIQSNIVPIQNFDGIGQGSFGFADSVLPPDSTGAVGATQFLQWVYTSLAIFDKGTGDLILGPLAGSSVWQALGGPCAANNNGEPIAQYDKAAGRWVLAQPVLSGPPYYFCIAVSQTVDATGSYNLYAFSMPNLPDSPKLAVWSDAYYASFNMFDGKTFLGAEACAFDRGSMLSGNAAATPICFLTAKTYSNLLPSDLDSATPPPTGSPNCFLGLGTNALNLWKFHVDFSNPANSTFVQTTVPVAAFKRAGLTSIPQKATAQHLDSLSDRLMYRAAYRNFGDHESLVVNHTVKPAAGVADLRWYELRNLNGTPTVFQQGTYDPDTKARWMGGAAMDGNGDIAIAYNISAGSMHPALGFAVRVPSDSLGELESENILMAGTGSQTDASAWGAYGGLSIDPEDDCTFWFTGEYVQGTGALDWHTRIGSFSISSCPSTNPAIQIVSMPPFGSSGSLQGTVSNVSPAQYEVGVLLFVPGLGWWSKPTCAGLLTPINSDSTWSANVDTGGVDSTATKYVAYLVPQGANATCQKGIDGLPSDLESQAVARAYVTRTNPSERTVAFSGLTWSVTANPAELNPGPCYFSDSSNNVFVDAHGWLHLKLTDNGGTWNCVQVVSQQAFAYGKYTFHLSSDVSDLDPNVVVGLFTWSDDPLYSGAISPWVNSPSGSVPSHGELDVEFSKFGNASDVNNAQFVVQPYTNPNALLRFQMPSGLNGSTHIIQWDPTGIAFQSLQSNGAVIQSYSCPGAVPPPADIGGWPGPDPSPQGVRLNVWLYNGQPPTNGQPVEVVVKSFKFVPFSK